MKLYYYFDQEADVLYFSQGKPSAKDQSEEAKNDTILRIDPATRKVRGFTILNFASRGGKKSAAIALPIQAELSPVK